MSIVAERINQETDVKRFHISHSISAYTFPKEALIDQVRFDESHTHVSLKDGRILSIPLSWIPTLQDARAEARLKYSINRSRTMIVWGPERSGINDEIRIADYLC